jgi:hypothetical protein
VPPYDPVLGALMRCVPRTSVRYIQISDTQTTPYISMKALERMPVRSISAPNMIGSTKPPRPPANPTTPEMTPMLPRIFVGDVLEDRGLAKRPANAEDEDQRREEVDVEADVEGSRAVDRQDGEVGLRVAQQEQADPAQPQHPPGHGVRPETIGKPAADCAQHAAGQGKTGCQQGRGGDVEAELADVILDHPQAHRDVAAEDDRVVLTELPDLGVLQRPQLLAPGDLRIDQVRRIGMTQRPEQDRRAEHDSGVHLRHGRPAKGDDQRWSDEFIDRGAGVAGTIDAHGKSLAFPAEPARHVRRANGE